MKLSEIESNYTLNSKGTRIMSPGKFEGEPTYAPHFYELWLDGSYDRLLEGNAALFNITPDDLAEFPSLDGVGAVVTWETEQGFCYCEEAEPCEYCDEPWCPDHECIGTRGEAQHADMMERDH